MIQYVVMGSLQNTASNAQRGNKNEEITSFKKLNILSFQGPIAMFAIQQGEPYDRVLQRAHLGGCLWETQKYLA